MFVRIYSRKDSLEAVIADRAERVVRTAVFANTPEGHHQLLVWARVDESIERFGSDGAPNLGARLARDPVAYAVGAHDVAAPYGA